MSASTKSITAMPVDLPAVEELEQALARGELRLHYQPIVQLETGRLDELEALIRWEHPTRGLLSPDFFVPLAEASGLTIPIGQWVIETACCQLATWQRAAGHHLDIVVGVNVSTPQFQLPDFAAGVVRTLEATGVHPSQLKLELTESVAIADVALTAATLRTLREMGLLLALDDFGTGYSSLSYLRRFPFHTLKIDRAFVSGDEEADVAIVRAIVAVGHALGLSITAEGIETAEQLARLQALGADRGQGYYFARPLPPEQIFPFLLG